MTQRKPNPMANPSGFFSEDHHIYWSESMKPTDEWNKPDNPTQIKLIFHDDHYPVAEC